MARSTRINVRAIIQQDGNVLLCRFLDKQTNYQFFPGGGVEFGEDIEGALRRELKEELGVRVLSSSFIGGVENIFDNNGQPYHELNLLFSTTIDSKDPVSKEIGHLAFDWLPIENLKSKNVLPRQLVVAVVNWVKDGQNFWVGLNKA